MQPYPINRGGPPACVTPVAIANQNAHVPVFRPMPSSLPYVVVTPPSSASTPTLTYEQQLFLAQRGVPQANVPLPALANRGSLPPPGRLTTVQAAYLNQRPTFGAVAPNAAQPYPVAGPQLVQRVQPGKDETPLRVQPDRR